jgi:hypothetical protein
MTTVPDCYCVSCLTGRWEPDPACLWLQESMREESIYAYA